MTKDERNKLILIGGASAVAIYLIVKGNKEREQRIHRSVEDCEKEIAPYEETLEEMTAEEYKKDMISNQRVHSMRMKVKEARDKSLKKEVM